MSKIPEYQPPLPQKVILILFLTIVGIIIFNLSSISIDNLWFLLFGELFIILPALIYILKIRHPITKAFRIKSITKKQLFSSIVLFIPVYILTDELDRLIMHVFPPPEELYHEIRELVMFTTVPQTLLLIFTGVLVAAVVEEMLFRGMLQHSLEYYRDPAIAIVLSSVLFAIMHFNPWTSLQILVLGLVFGYITWQTGTILPAIILHALNNALSMIFINLSPDHISWYADSGHVNPVWIIFAMATLVPAFRTFQQK